MTSKPRLSESFLQTRLKLNHLSFILALAELGSLAKAAQRLNISQPAATNLLKDIEDSLDVRLFDRSRHGVKPTLYGEALIPALGRIQGELRQATENLAALRAGMAGRVIIGTLISAAASLLPLSMARLHAKWPAISAKILQQTDDELIPMLRTGDLDMIVGRLPQPDDAHGLALEELYREDFVLTARVGHRLAARASPQLEELEHVDWVLPPAQTTTRRELVALLLKAGLSPPRVIAESTSILFNLRLVEASDAVSLVPLHLARYFSAMGQIAAIDVNVPLNPSRVGIVTVKDRPVTPAAGEMIAVIRQVAAELPRDP